MSRHIKQREHKRKKRGAAKRKREKEEAHAESLGRGGLQRVLGTASAPRSVSTVTVRRRVALRSCVAYLVGSTAVGKKNRGEGVGGGAEGKRPAGAACRNDVMIKSAFADGASAFADVRQHLLMHRRGRRGGGGV